MALSNEYKIKILRFLGYPFGTIDSTSMDYSNLVVRKLAAISGDAQSEVELLIESIIEADTRLDLQLKQAGIKRIDEIEFSENGRSTLKSEKARLVGDLSSLIGLPVMKRSGMGSVVV